MVGYRTSELSFTEGGDENWRYMFGETVYMSLATKHKYYLLIYAALHCLRVDFLPLCASLQSASDSFVVT